MPGVAPGYANGQPPLELIDALCYINVVSFTFGA